jgi:hypothetical protein
MVGTPATKRPPMWHEKIAECYNSPREYVSLELPDLHMDFLEAMTLRFEDMHGGPITAAQVKIRMGDARASMISFINRWEVSGNGFGQPRAFGQDQFGNLSAEIKAINGQR